MCLSLPLPVSLYLLWQVLESAVSGVLGRMVWAVSRAAAREQLHGAAEGEGHLPLVPQGGHGGVGWAGWRVGGWGGGRAAGVYGMYGRAGRPDLTLGYKERQVGDDGGCGLWLLGD